MSTKILLNLVATQLKYKQLWKRYYSAFNCLKCQLTTTYLLLTSSAQHKNAPQRYYGQPPHKAAKRLRHKNTAQPHKALLFIPFPFGLRSGR